MSLSKEHQAFRLYKTPSLDTIEVHATGKIGGVELDFVVAGVDVAVHHDCHLLPERVEDCKRYVGTER